MRLPSSNQPRAEIDGLSSFWRESNFEQVAGVNGKEKRRACGVNVVCEGMYMYAQKVLLFESMTAPKRGPYLSQ